MHIKCSAKTDVGKKRLINEDSFCAAENIGLFLVADGLGGCPAGDVASKTAVEVVKKCLTKWLRKGPPNSEIFVRAVQLANRTVFEMSEKSEDIKGMGTTIAGILICNGGFAAAHVGDSRIYRIRDNFIEQLSEDHSVTGMQLSRGLITKEEAKTSAYRSVVTRSLGAAGSVEVDTREEDAVENDLILICSDGLTSLADDSEILDVAKRNYDNLPRMAKELIRLANFNGGDDNITVVLVQFL